ncbi:hypothetical protein PSYPI_48997, partial [Pseudomonas syringae pv. pisi str. 1704B]
RGQPQLLASPLANPMADSNLLPANGTLLVLGGTGG